MTERKILLLWVARPWFVVIFSLFVCLFVLLCFAYGYMYVDNGRNDPKYLGNKIFL